MKLEKIINLKETYFELLNAKKALWEQSKFLFEQHQSLILKQNNKVALKYNDIQDELITKELHKVNKRMKEILAKVTEQEQNEWREELKARA